jgi:hypothetical protein
MTRSRWIGWDAVAADVDISHLGGGAVNQGYRLMLVDKDGVLVSEFQLTENALADPAAFVAALKESIENVEEADA